jgi:hypothetical protein
LFRTPVFRTLGGFPTDYGPAGDYVFWLRACAECPVVLFPGDLFWYREHRGQELSSPAGARQYARLGGVTWRALRAPSCPLDEAERAIAKRNTAYATAKQIWRDARAGRWGLGLYRLRHSGLTAAEWVRWLRPPKRSGLAGSPLDGRGEYVVPTWMRLR